MNIRCVFSSLFIERSVYVFDGGLEKAVIPPILVHVKSVINMLTQFRVDTVFIIITIFFYL